MEGLNAYKWGTETRDSYRHAGTDIRTHTGKDGFFYISVDQDAYVESLVDVEIPGNRIRAGGPMNAKAVAACRTALGALQWLAIQKTQPQLCARCNLLLTEVVTDGRLEHAREIQTMIGEVRQDPSHLKFMKFKDAKKWDDVVFISMGDQAHTNRPKGDSTGGMLTLVSGPDSVSGKVSPMCLSLMVKLEVEAQGNR